MTAHEALLKYISDNSSYDEGVNLFAASTAEVPPGNGPFVSFLQYGGPGPRGTHNDGPNAYRRPSFQVVVVATRGDVARDQAYVIQTLLDLWSDPNVRAAGGVEINGVWFLQITPQEPGELTTGGIGRARWAFNVFTCHKGVSA